MTTFKSLLFILSSTFMLTNCRTQIKVKEEDKVFHAGSVSSGFGGIFFGLYKDNNYEFCDGDFMDAGCYTGLYNLSGDTIILLQLRKHDGIPTNKFIIRRYNDMDSSYWFWKYPEHKADWQYMRHNDSSIGSTGDIFPLDEMNKIKFDRNNYFLIRLDSLKKKPLTLCCLLPGWLDVVAISCSYQSAAVTGRQFLNLDFVIFRFNFLIRFYSWDGESQMPALQQAAGH